MAEALPIEKIRELLEKANRSPSRTLIRYDHGGGRLYIPGDGDERRDLIADFYDEANREFYYRAPENIEALLAEVQRLQQEVHSSYLEHPTSSAYQAALADRTSWENRAKSAEHALQEAQQANAAHLSAIDGLTEQLKERLKDLTAARHALDVMTGKRDDMASYYEQALEKLRASEATLDGLRLQLRAKETTS